MGDDASLPLVSVIIPVRNSPQFLRSCTASLLSSSYKNIEIIIVDDASSDDTPKVATELNLRLLPLETRVGPAGARNRGAEIASGEYLFFVDADVCVHPETVGLVVDSFLSNPEIDAVFGSYDLMPRVPNVVSQYKNLFHHFVHQQAAEEASTFWSGCGAIKRSVFLAMGGFDTSYGRPCIEDIELGVRMHQAGRRIMLNKQIQVTHLKRWTLLSVIKTDFWDRGVPWTELMLRCGAAPNDLNLKLSQRICALIAVATFLMLLTGIWSTYVLLLLPVLGFLSMQLLDWWTLKRRTPTFIRFLAVCVSIGVVIALVVRFRIWALIALVHVLAVILMNYKFYVFFARHRHPLFAALVMPLHFIYYLYSVASFATGVALFLWKAKIIPYFAVGNANARLR